MLFTLQITTLSAIWVLLFAAATYSSSVKRIPDNASLASDTPKDNSKNCIEIPDETLEGILGSAFNPRYMSVQAPPSEDDLSVGHKRTTNDIEDFYVSSNFTEEFDMQPAWEVNNHVLISKKQYYRKERRKRDADNFFWSKAVNYSQQFRCSSKVVWADLGSEYFPRYLRTVKCLSEHCWFKLFECKPRSFTIKLLRRKKGICTIMDEQGLVRGSVGLPKELRELWIWEERAVNFCCDCSLVGKKDAD